MSSLYTPLETKLIAAPFFKTLEREDLPGLSTNAPKKPFHEEECQHLCQRPLQQYTCNKLEQQLNWQRIVKVMGWGKKWYIYIFLNKRLLVVGIIHTNRNPREFHRVYSIIYRIFMYMSTFTYFHYILFTFVFFAAKCYCCICRWKWWILWVICILSDPGFFFCFPTTPPPAPSTNFRYFLPM